MVYAAIALLFSSCGKSSQPAAEDLLSDVARLGEEGKAAESRAKAQQGMDWFGGTDSYYRWRFSLYLDPGPDKAQEALLHSPLPPYLGGTRAEVKALWARYRADGQRPETLVTQARAVAEALHDEWAIAWTDYLLATRLLDFNPKQYAKAGELLESVVRRARNLKEPPDPRSWPYGLLGKALINLSMARMNLGRHDETVALCQEAVKLPLKSTDRGIAEINLGWSWLQLGEDAKSLEHTTIAANLFKEMGRPNQTVLRNLAAYYIRQGEFPKAADKLREALESTSDSDNGLKAASWADRAEVAVLERNFDFAKDAVNQAIRLSNFNGEIHSQEDAHVVFLQSRIAEQRSDGGGAALEGYRRVFRAADAWSSMQLEAAGRRASILAAAKRYQDAGAQYKEAADLLESMRGRLTQDESKLSFFEAPSALFDQYVDFLVSQNKNEDALIVADGSRARLLSDAQNGGLARLNPTALKERLAKAGGVALFYWLGASKSYLWIVAGTMVKLVHLKRPTEIPKLAKAYAEAVALKPRLSPGDRQTGCELREIILASAADYLTKDRRVFMVLDGELGLINPESLPDCRDGHQSWFINEVNVSVAPSLAFLQRPPPLRKPVRDLLAIGDADGTPEFPRLENAGLELDAVTKPFPGRQKSIRGKQARPRAYGEADPIQYDMIHFTAHGEAIASNPLDSAVILSEDPDSKAFKLYAREIAKKTIEARLVTISACKSASSRTYRGEGVVGLAWAFLRAGAGQVVAGVWDVGDQLARDLMSRFYQGIHGGKQPAEALRTAKLDIMQGYKSPHDWAVFEIFAGYIEP